MFIDLKVLAYPEPPGYIEWIEENSSSACKLRQNSANLDSQNLEAFQSCLSVGGFATLPH